MRTLKKILPLPGLFYFLILLCVALWGREIPIQYAPIQLDTLTSTLLEVIKTSKYGDPIYFATAAKDIAENGWLSSNNAWIFNLWPPGFVLLQALIIKILGPGAPVVLVLQIMAALLFAFILTYFYDFLKTKINSHAVFVLPLLIFAFPVSRMFLLQPPGIIFGESFAIGFFLLSIFLAIYSVKRHLLYYAACAGFFLALSAYFRSQFEIILLSLTGWSFLLLIVNKLFWQRKYSDSRLLKITTRTMLVVIVIAHLAMLPWRIYHWVVQGSPSWVYTSSLVFKNSVMTSESLSGPKKFLLEGGGNLVCRIDPNTCNDLVNAKINFLKTLISHPVEFFSLKFGLIGKYWFSSIYNFTNLQFNSTFVDIITNGLLLIAFLTVMILLFARRIRADSLWLLLIWFNASFASAYMLIFTLVHFEVRYFYVPKIFYIGMALIISCLYYRPIQDIYTENSR